MSEQIPNNPDYLLHHPDAIQDPQKAEYMAYAGKQHEDHAAHARGQLEYASKNATGFVEAREPRGNPDWDRVYSKGSIRYTDQRGEKANLNIAPIEDRIDEENKSADLAYEVSGKVYDIIKKTKR